MSQSETYEAQHLKREVTSLHAKPNNIEIDAQKTIKAYDKAFAEKGIQATSKRDYPRSGVGYRQVQRLIQYDSIVKRDKGITKKIISMTVQPVTIDKQQKYALYYHGHYVGFDAWDNEIWCSFTEGFHYKPKIQFVPTDLVNPFDSKTGERRGSYKPIGYSLVHDIFIPESPKERRKFLEKLIKDLDVSNCVYSYRVANPENDHASHHGEISFNNLCDLTFTQLEELQTKLYYKDSSGSLRDKDNLRVQYDPSTKKVESLGER
jgi:hypothetical protein